MFRAFNLVQLQQQKVPPLLLQPLAETAIKYGVAELKGHACIETEHKSSCYAHPLSAPPPSIYVSCCGTLSLSSP